MYRETSSRDWITKLNFVYDESHFGEYVHETDRISDNVSLNARSMMSKLNEEQKEIVDLYKTYLEMPDRLESSIPSIVLLTGKGGTGKSFVIKTLIEHGKEHGNIPWTTETNNLNATDIGGCTISKLLQEAFEANGDN